VPIIEPLRPIRDRLTSGKGPGDRRILGTKGGVISTATLRDATHWDQLVNETGLSGLVRQGLRHTALTWMADSSAAVRAATSVLLHPTRPSSCSMRQWMHSSGRPPIRGRGGSNPPAWMICSLDQVPRRSCAAHSLEMGGLQHFQAPKSAQLVRISVRSDVHTDAEMRMACMGQ